ncbi:MAG TPA: PAS domain S-box protein [bacterium]|nr:PAS domain S-box protein [bacterium]
MSRTIEEGLTFSSGSAEPAENRLLLLEPTDRDRSLSCTTLEEAGVQCVSCADVDELIRESKRGTAAILLAEEALAGSALSKLRGMLSAQPTWSDLPVLVMMKTSSDSDAVLRNLEFLGNVIFLERPLRIIALLSAVRMAFRARERQYEIRDQVLQREQALATLRKQADLLEQTHDAIFIFELGGPVTYWNKGAEQLYGYTRSEAVGKLASELLQTKHPRGVQSIFESLRGNPYWAGELEHRSKEGRRILVESRLQLIPQTGSPGFVLESNRDITDRRRADARLAAEHAVTRIIGASETFHSAVPGILETLRAHLPADFAELWLHDRERNVLRCVETHRGAQDAMREDSALMQFELKSQRMVCARDQGLSGRVWSYMSPVFSPNLTADPDFDRSDGATQAGLCAGLGFPIIGGVQFIGVINCFSREPIEFDHPLMEMMRAIGSEVGQFAQRKEMEHALLRSESDLSDFFENASIGLHWMGPDGIIQRANRAELDMLGYSADEYVGHHIAEFHVDQEMIRDILDRLEHGEAPVNYDSQMRHKNGSVRYVRISATVFRENDQFIHTRCFTRDITERKRVEMELQESNRRKDEFLATLAHELRNPLAPIKNAVQLFRMQELAAPELRWGRDVIERQVTQLTRLVDDLLDVSRISRGKIELRRERIQLSEIVRSALETTRPIIDAHHHRLVISLPSESIVLDADPLRLSQAISNLLSNAAKYTPDRGKIELSASLEDEMVMICVEDNGIGIRPEMLPHVFEMFDQGDVSLERGYGGLGVGLTLVKRFVEMHGGSVEVFSEGPQKGSAFVLRIPVASEADASEADASEADACTLSVNSLRIIVVDDNRDHAESLAHLLRTQGHLVRTAYSGYQALALGPGFVPDVILMDLGLPGMSGFETIRRIRAKEWSWGTLMITLSGWGQEETRQRSLQAGSHAHLVKPVDPFDLNQLFVTHQRTRPMN